MNPNLLNGFINQIAVDLNLMTPDAQARVLEVQARCVALAAKGVMYTAASANDDKQWEADRTRLGVDDAALEAARTQVKSGAGVDAKKVPASGQIAAAIGAVDGDIANALLTAQAAQRALTTIGFVFDPSADHTHNPALFGHSSDKDPLELRFAQEANKLASEIAAEVRSPAFKSAAGNVQESALNDYAAVITNLKTQALEAYHSSAVALGVRAAELAKANDPRATRAAEVADELNQSTIQLGGRGITPEELAEYAAKRTGGPSGPNQAQQGSSFADRVSGKNKLNGPSQHIG